MTFRNLPRFDITDPELKQQAAHADSGDGGLNGKYIAEITRASLEKSNNGSIFFTLAFKMPNGKVYEQESKQIVTATGEPGYYHGKLAQLFFLLHARDTIGNVEVDSFDRNAGERKITPTPSYVDLLGKKIGVVLDFQQRYPESKGINGYTNREIPNKQSDPSGYEAARAEATTVWMPNYEQEPRPVFEFTKFFDPKTEKTWAEMMDDQCTEPTEVARELARLHKKDVTAQANGKRAWSAYDYDPERWDKERQRKLRNRLRNNGLVYDASLFIPASPLDTPATQADVASVEYDDIP